MKGQMPGLMIVHVPGIVYSGETDEQAVARDRAAERHNRAVMKARQQAARAMNEPAKFYHAWCRVHAPHLLDKEGAA